MRDYKTVKTSHEVWYVILKNHPEMVVFGSYLLYERHRSLIKRRQRSVEQKAIADMVEAIGSMVRECEAVFDGIAEAYQPLE